MSGVNKVILVGNLGADPEVRKLENGTTVTRIRIATSETYKKPNGEKIDKTEWHSITLWRGLGEIAGNYLKKGSKVYVEGKLRSREYTDKEGIQRRSTEVEAENMVLLDARKSDSGSGYSESYSSASSSQSVSEPAESSQASTEDDLPF